ncbi:lipid A-modifier LpxR family protein [Hyphomonas sp. NPDC076900]|uniref:lipid A-modifier LpxR family protein n=1 Tax=unclassified Hyphomonas TaxID=2630699 RepID=UPI003CFBEDBA
MMIAFATSLASLACQGCVSGDVAGHAYAEAATEPSLGMMLAVPGRIGAGPMNTPSEEASAALAASATTTVITPLTSADAPVSVVALSGPQPAFSLTGSGTSSLSVVDSNLAWTGSSALSRVAADLATRRAGRPVEMVQDMSLGLSIAAPASRTGLAFDVGLAPRVAIRDEGDLTSQRFGGEVRFGQGLNLTNNNGQPEGWYLFVGADGEALVWDNSDSTPSLSDVFDVQVTDQVTVGDLQAGVSIQRAGGELSFSYIRREMKFDDRNRSLKDTEDFAGITFTMRR